MLICALTRFIKESLHPAKVLNTTPVKRHADTFTYRLYIHLTNEI